MMNSFKNILEAAKQGGVKKLVVPRPAGEDLRLLAVRPLPAISSRVSIGDSKSLRVLIGEALSLPTGEDHELIEEK